MHDEPPRPPVAKKRAYRKPGLRVYGQVRELTGAAGGTMNGDGGQMMFGSDRRMKRNIVRIGEHPRGFGLYLFDYEPERQARWGRERQFGVMADEVEVVSGRGLRRCRRLQAGRLRDARDLPRATRRRLRAARR